MGRHKATVLLGSVVLAVALAVVAAILLGLLPRWASLGKPFTLRHGQTAFILGTKLRVQYASCWHIHSLERPPKAETELLATLDRDTASVWLEYQEPAIVGDYRITPRDIPFNCNGNDAGKIKLVVTRLK